MRSTGFGGAQVGIGSSLPLRARLLTVPGSPRLSLPLTSRLAASGLLPAHPIDAEAADRSVLG
ncbi:hypothetical protein AB4Y77_21250 [Paenarthrobacter sp. YAF11_1]